MEETYHSLGNHGKAGGGEYNDVSPVPEHRKSGFIDSIRKAQSRLQCRNPLFILASRHDFVRNCT